MARVLISMPEKFLDEIDSVANNENRTRSELIREALRTYMYRNQVRNSSKSVSNAELLDALLGQKYNKNRNRGNEKLSNDNS